QVLVPLSCSAITSASLEPNGIAVMDAGSVISMVAGYPFSPGRTFIRRGERAEFSRHRYSVLISLLPCIVDILRLSCGKPLYFMTSSACSSAGRGTSNMASLYSWYSAHGQGTTAPVTCPLGTG